MTIAFLNCQLRCAAAFSPSVKKPWTNDNLNTELPQGRLMAGKTSENLMLINP